jgi:hypothetical protein
MGKVMNLLFNQELKQKERKQLLKIPKINIYYNTKEKTNG